MLQGNNTLIIIEAFVFLILFIFFPQWAAILFIIGVIVGVVQLYMRLRGSKI